MLWNTKKLIQNLVVLCGVTLFPVLGVAELPITWLPSSSDSVQGVSSTIEPTWQRQIVQGLYQSGVLSHTRAQYRQVKIKLYNTAYQPYAIAFLYSNTFFKFHTARVDLDKDGNVQRVIPHYRLQRRDFLHLPQAASACQDNNIKAMLFLPEYVNIPGYVPCSRPSTEPFDNRQYCRMLSAFKTHYANGQYVALLGKDATVAHFNHFISCPKLQFYMDLSGEDSDPDNNLPAGVAFWAYDPTEINDNTDPKITSSDFNVNASPSLQMAIIGGCHLFSNNVP